MKQLQLKVLAMALFIGTLSACVATVPVTNVRNCSNAPNNGGFYYNLPKTIVTVDITISLTKTSKGKFHDMAWEIFGDSSKPGKEFKIEEIKLDNYAAVDSSQWYFVDLSKNGLFRRVSITTTLGENGVISGASVEAENKAMDYTLEAISFAATIASKFIPFSSGSASLILQNAMSTELEMKHSSKPAKMTHRDSAYALLRQIGELETQRTNLITNTESQISADALQLMLKEIDNKKMKLLSLFFGTETVKVTTLHFEDSAIQNRELFRLSDTSGLFGLPTYMNINSAFLGKGGVSKSVTLQFTDPSSILASMGSTALNSKESGFYYRIPVNRTVQICVDNVIRQQRNVLIAQSGIVTSLPAKAGSGKTKYELKYDPKTGALLEIKVNGEPVSSETVDNAVATGKEILNTIKPDELEELEKQRKILEEKKKIEELQQEQ